jgi:hypothetical protein
LCQSSASGSIHIEIVTNKPATGKFYFIVTLNYSKGLPMVSIVLSEPINGNSKFQGAPASYGPPFTTVGISGKVVSVSPGDACSRIVNSEELSGNIAFFSRGNCPFIEKMRNVQQAGAIAAVIANDRESNLHFLNNHLILFLGNLFTMSGTDAVDIHTPSVLISLKDAQLLKANINDLKVTLQVTSSYDLNKPDIIENTVITLDPQGTQFLSRDHAFQWISQEMQKLGFDIVVESLQELPSKQP